MNPNDPIPGRIVSWGDDDTLTNTRGLLLVRPGPHRGALVVVFATELGTEVFRFDTKSAELLLVDAPFDALPPGFKAKAAALSGRRTSPTHTGIVSLPGKMAFKRADGIELVFLPDCNAGAYAVPLAVERPRK